MLKRYLVTAGVFLLIDIVWLTLISPKLYKAQIGHLMSGKVNYLAAGLFYLIFIGALLFFVIDPAIQVRSIARALWTGAFLGLAMYATYDLTNQATLKDWPPLITAIDLAWGTFITAATSGIVTLIFK
ncbi:MAG: DUF2177 family protein [Christensenellales bacterium]